MLIVGGKEVREIGKTDISARKQETHLPHYTRHLDDTSMHDVASPGGRGGAGMLRGAGGPLFSTFLELENYQDSTRVKFVF